MGLKDDTERCEGCGGDMRGAAIPADNLHYYNSGPNGELLSTIEDYRSVVDQLANPTTHFSRVIGVEYGYDCPERHDGVSEWVCPDCGRREGRFSGKILGEGELEARPR